ncbi:MAG: deoxyribodipyrimidine photo-lyase, partial [Hyphomonadaceae bacterium]
MPDRPALFWFRDDLRLADNPGLAAACATGRPVILLYVLDEESRESRAPGGASKWWLDKSLRALAERIAAKGGRLVLRK